MEQLLCEIEYFITFTVLKQLVELGCFPVETARQANVALAETYGVSSSLFSGSRDRYEPISVIWLV